MSLPPPKPWTSVLQLLCFIGIALAVPAMVCSKVSVAEIETFPGGQRIEPVSERARLQVSRPEWILIGNSMLNSRISSPALAQLSGRSVRKVAEGGTQSALWFLFLKQIILKSNVHPTWITFVFRETDLTWPDFRVSGQNAELIAALEGPAQPEWREVMGWRDDSGAGLTGATASAIKSFLPDAAMQTYARTRLQALVFELTEFGHSVPHGVRKMELNELFSLTGLRHDLGSDVGQASAATSSSQSSGGTTGMADPGVYDGGPMSFDPSTRASFLPHIIALAKANGIHLHFHRVKRRVQASSDAPDGRLIAQYMTDLRTYLKAEHCAFTDESQDPAITADLFADGDHISATPEAQQRYLETFWQRVRPIIGDGSAKPQP